MKERNHSSVNIVKLAFLKMLLSQMVYCLHKNTLPFIIFTWLLLQYSYCMLSVTTVTLSQAIYIYSTLTTVDADEISSDDEKFVGCDILWEDHGSGSDNAHNIVDQKSSLPSESIGNPTADESPAHSTNGKDGDCHGVHKGWGFVCHIFPKISLTVGFADKLFNDLKC